MTPIKLPGRQYDCIVDFPWESGTIVSIQFRHKTGELVESYNLQADMGEFNKYLWFIPAAKDFFEKLLSRSA